MAYIAPSTRSAGALITSAIWNQDVVANPIALYSGAMSITSQAAFDDISASSATQLGRSDKRQLRESFRGLSVRTSPNADVLATTVVLTHADEIVCSNGVRRTPADNLAAVITTAGIGGLRASQAETASTWYKIMYAYGGSGEGLYLEQAKDYYPTGSEFTTTPDASRALRRATSTATDKLAQGVQFSTAGPFSFVDVKLARNGSVVGNIWFSVQASSGGDASGTPLKTTQKIDASLISTSNQNIRLVFYDPYSVLASATQYHLVMEGDYTRSDTVNIAWLGVAAGGYSGGVAREYNGATWANASGVGDFYFRNYIVRNNNAVAPPTGYDSGYAQIGWVYNTSSSDFRAFSAKDRYVLHVGTETNFGDFTATIGALADLSAYLPPVPVMVPLGARNTNVGGVTFLGGIPDGYSINGIGAYGAGIVTSATGNAELTTSPIITDTQAIYVKASAATSRAFYVGYEW